jgi:N-formylglutamate amidohydrolase
MDSLVAHWHIACLALAGIERNRDWNQDMGRSGTGQPSLYEMEPVEPELAIPFETTGPERPECPLVLSSPHSGQAYPARFLAAARLDELAIRRSEDVYVDELFAAATLCGARLLRAHFPRAYLDANREPYELDPRMFEGRLPSYANTRSLRVAGGLGTIARIVGEAQEIYTGTMPVEEALRRIDGLYKPYHSALRGLMRQAFSDFGIAVLLDCHSMPSWTGSGAKQERIEADIVLGDRYGTSCSPAIADFVERELRGLGYQVQRNKPYAGGFITEQYGNPGSGFHALQIEINRALYIDEASLEKKPAFAQVSADLVEMTERLIGLAMEMARNTGRALAAE